MDLKVLKFPEPSLKKPAKSVISTGEAERKTLSRMAETMYLNKGVGLAAVQVGIDRQLAVIDVGDGLIKMINPVIIKREGSKAEEEGCLSVSGITVKVKRAKKVVVTFLNENGAVAELKADGLLARVIQHEVDHLSGKLIIDYLSPVKRLFLKKRKAVS